MMGFCFGSCKCETALEVSPRNTVRRLKSSRQLVSFTYQELCRATNNFKVKLGEGGFGEVYKGLLPASKQQSRLAPAPVAVKCLSAESRQGLKEFEAEVKTFSQIRHKNLVELIGWCCECTGGSNKRILLVYELLPNNSLDYVLYKDANTEKCSWEERYRIVSGLADALLYLHQEETAILHRDIKPSNILLDELYSPKLGDFGLSRKLGKEVPYYRTASNDAPLFGSKGYIAPELLLDDKFTKETDIYSFGVVLLEVASGKRPLECIDIRNPPRNYNSSTQPLIESVWDLYEQERLLEAADKRLHHMFNKAQMRRVLIAGLACCHPDPQARLTIKEAVNVLSGAEELPCIPRKMPPPSDRLAYSVQHFHDVAFGSLDGETTSATSTYHTALSVL